MTNQVFLIGRLGETPKVETVRDKRVCTVSVATWESYYDKQNEKWEQITEWHSVVVWGDATKRLEKLVSGDIVAVDGKIRTRSWEKDGVRHYKTEIIGYIKAVPSKKGVVAEPAPEVPNVNSSGVREEQIFPQGAEGEDDLPF